MTKRPAITVRNAQRKLRIDAKALKDFAARALSEVLALPARAGDVLENLPEITVLLVSDRRMAALHQEFMNIPGATDVLTFQDGDIFISVETARANAASFRTSLAQEIRLYLVHGLLHLRGFDHTDAAKARAMKAAQERILARLTTG